MSSNSFTKNISKLSFISIIVFLSAILLMGCYQSVSLKRTPSNSDALVVNKSAQLPPAYLMSIQVSLNEAPTNFNPTFEQRFVGRLQEAGIFKDVVGIAGREKRSDEVHYNLFLKEDEIQHLDRVGNFIKGFFVGVSLFVLTPVLPYDYGHEVNMALTVIKPNGVEKKYYATAETSAIYTPSHAHTATQKAIGDAVEKCIVSIVNQLCTDGDLRSF